MCVVVSHVAGLVQSPSTLHPTQLPRPSQTLPPLELQALPRVTSPNEGVPLVHTPVWQSLGGVGLSVLSLALPTPPEPSQVTTLQSPAVWNPAGALPDGSSSTPQLPVVQVRVSQAVSEPGQSLGWLQLAPVVPVVLVPVVVVPVVDVVEVDVVPVVVVEVVLVVPVVVVDVVEVVDVDDELELLLDELELLELDTLPVLPPVVPLLPPIEPESEPDPESLVPEAEPESVVPLPVVLELLVLPPVELPWLPCEPWLLPLVVVLPESVAVVLDAPAAPLL